MPSEKSVCRSRKNNFRTGHGTTDCSKLAKEYVKAVYYLKYAEYIMGNAGLNEARLLESRLESRLPGEISTTSDMQMTPALWQKVKRN